MRDPMSAPRSKPHRRIRKLGPTQPYLLGPLRDAFDAWLEAATLRNGDDLAFREIRKGAQALSWLYVERRGEVDLASRTIDGRGKRAALTTYYAPLHCLTAHHALATVGAERFGATPRLFDLGAGTGASGAAIARALDAGDVTAIDRSGFALKEARATYAAFGVLARTSRGRIPDVLPRVEAGDVWVLGWSANELDAAARDALLDRIVRAIGFGGRLVLLEPLAGAAVPWWRTWRETLTPLGVEEHECKVPVALPEWIARLDKATGLDHRVLGARMMVGPLPRGAEEPDDAAE
jgi:SAM-dependent methyltransferase